VDLQVATLVRADWLFLLTDVDALYTANPNVDPAALPIPEVHDLEQLQVRPLPLPLPRSPQFPRSSLFCLLPRLRASAFCRKSGLPPFAGARVFRLLPVLESSAFCRDSGVLPVAGARESLLPFAGVPLSRVLPLPCVLPGLGSSAFCRGSALPSSLLCSFSPSAWVRVSHTLADEPGSHIHSHIHRGDKHRKGGGVHESQPSALFEGRSLFVCLAALQVS
jgi:Amino acid kinase family